MSGVPPNSETLINASLIGRRFTSRGQRPRSNRRELDVCHVVSRSAMWDVRWET